MDQQLYVNHQPRPFLFADQVERNRRSHGDELEEQEARADQEGMLPHKLDITPPAHEDD